MNLILIKRAVSCKLQFQLIQIPNSLVKRIKRVKSEGTQIYNDFIEKSDKKWKNHEFNLNQKSGILQTSIQTHLNTKLFIKVCKMCKKRGHTNLHRVKVIKT
jgi:hypothetical protein